MESAHCEYEERGGIRAFGGMGGGGSKDGEPIRRGHLQCVVCFEVLYNGPGCVVLPCGDPIHHHCLIQYIESSLGDR
jgi:hypothetical protein